MRMKVTYRIPTEQYAFAEFSFESDNTEASMFKEAYDDLVQAFKPQAGLSVKEFNAWIDRYLTDNTGDIEQYVKMSPEQTNIIQTIKRSVARISAKK